MEKLTTIPMGNKSDSGIVIVEDKQLIDLDETFESTVNDTTTKALTEYLKDGKLSRQVAKELKVDGVESLEPGSTVYNAKMSGAGFLSVVAKGTADFIKKIIEYIKDGVNWVIRQVKETVNFFSKYRDLEKQNELVKDIHAGFERAGIPTLGVVNIDKVFEKHPHLTKRIEVFRTLKPKMMEYNTYVERLAQSLPDIRRAVTELNQVSLAIPHIQRTVESNIKNLRHKAKNNTLVPSDIDKMYDAIYSDLFTRFSNAKVKQAVNKVVGIINGDEVAALKNELDIDFSKSVTALKASLALTTEKVGPRELAERSKHLLDIKADITSRGYEYKVDIANGDLQKLTLILSQDDAGFLETLSKEMNDQRPIVLYRQIGGVIAGYSATIKAALDAISVVTSELSSIATYITRVEFVTSVYSFESVKEREDYIAQNIKKTGLKATDDGKDVEGFDQIREDAYSNRERTLRNVLNATMPDLMKKINTLSQSLNMGVKVNV